MSNIYSAKFMNEASATLKDKVFHKPVNETYLFSTMVALREMNNMINKETEKLYIHIAEAESKEEENKLFAEYFYQFKNIFQDFSNRVQQMRSRMVIAVENKVETWENLFKDDEYIANFNGEFNYSGYEFFHMEDSDYPRLNLQKLYQKEFDYIGQLMQDSGINASPSAKLKIIATVCNNFSNCSGDKNWIRELIKDMVDIDEKEINKSYSECIYNSLRDKYDIVVNKSALYTCKENVSDYDDIIDAATKLCDNLLCDLDKVAENISSFLFRNQDNKLIIDTDTDGIINRDYRLDTYSMNQLDLFMKNKINQIKKLLNVYSIAIGIKFDTAVDYINQNIDILRMAKEYDFKEDEEVSSEEPKDNEKPESDNDFELGDGVEDTDDGEEAIEEEPEDDDDLDDDSEGEDNNDSSNDEVSDNDDLEEESDPEFEISNDEFEEGYLFESELFELEMMCEMYDMHQSVRSALLLEEETPNDGDNKPAEPAVGAKTDAIAAKANIWQKIISKLVSLWNRFKDAITTMAKPRVDYLKANEKYINTSLKGVDGTVTLAYTPDLAALENLKIEDLNYNSMEQYLGSEEAYCTQYYNTYYANKGEKSFTDYMKEKILKDERSIRPTEEKYIKEAFNFCENYISKVDVIKRQTEIIEKAQRVAKDVSKVEESAVNNDHSMYFREMKDNTTKSEDQKDGEGKSAATDKSGKLAVYFKVSSQVLAAKMTMYQKLFNEYFKFCHWYIKAAGGPGFGGTSNEKENKEPSTSGDDVQKFN